MEDHRSLAHQTKGTWYCTSMRASVKLFQSKMQQVLLTHWTRKCETV